MTAYSRDELEAMVEKWLQANKHAEASGDWRGMAECYAVEATYGWNYGPEHDFMAVGRNESATSPPASRWTASTGGPTPTRRS